MCCFFFQAEDGIRDYKVTGVQTCALPISASSTFMPGWICSCLTMKAALLLAAKGLSSSTIQRSQDGQGRTWRREDRRQGRLGDRKSGGEGKRGDLGGRRIIKKKKKKRKVG